MNNSTQFTTDCPQATPASLSSGTNRCRQRCYLSMAKSRFCVHRGNKCLARRRLGGVGRAIKEIDGTSFRCSRKAVARDDEIAAITLLQAVGWQRDHH